MRFALDEIETRKEVSYSGEKAKCPNCGSIVIGKKGNVKAEHWAHKSNYDCDSWHEPITEWHLSWQNLFPKKYLEVSLKNGFNESHRADIRLNNGMVIEIQNSPINLIEIEKREAFYGVNNMIWILNGDKLLKNSYLTYKFSEKRFSLNFQSQII